MWSNSIINPFRLNQSPSFPSMISPSHLHPGPHLRSDILPSKPYCKEYFYKIHLAIAERTPFWRKKQGLDGFIGFRNLWTLKNNCAMTMAAAWAITYPSALPSSLTRSCYGTPEAWSVIGLSLVCTCRVCARISCPPSGKPSRQPFSPRSTGGTRNTCVL